jgi:hypothetical protein
MTVQSYNKKMTYANLYAILGDFFGIVYDVCVNDFNVCYGAGAYPMAGKDASYAQY